MEHDAYSGDYGLGFFGSSLEASATFVLHKTLGPLCFLCDAATSAGGGVTEHTVLPRDAYRQRVYLEPLGLYVQADTGRLASVTLSLSRRQVNVTFAPAALTPAGEQSYAVLRLRVDKVAVPPTSRPGTAFRMLHPADVPRRRSAFEIHPPPAGQSLTVALGYDDHAR